MTALFSFRSLARRIRLPFLLNNSYSTTADEVKYMAKGTGDLVLEKPESPLTCCGSGCQNCVYLTYAEDLMKYYKHKYGTDNDRGMAEAISEINKLTDESLKSYILMEIQMRYR